MYFTKGFAWLPILILAAMVIVGGAEYWQWQSSPQTPAVEPMATATEQTSQASTPAQAQQTPSMQSIDAYFFISGGHVYYLAPYAQEFDSPVSTTTKLLEGADPATFKRIVGFTKQETPEGMISTARYQDKNFIYTFALYRGLGGVYATVDTQPIPIPPAAFEWVVGAPQLDEYYTPHTSVTLVFNGVRYPIGTYTNCQTSNQPTDANEADPYVSCYFGGGGDEIGLFNESGHWVVKAGEIDEPQGPGSPGFRGNFKTVVALPAVQ